MSKTESNEETVLDLDDDNGIEIVEVVGLDEDSPAASVVPDDDPDELILSLDSPDPAEEESASGVAPVAAGGVAATPGRNPPELSDQERLLRIQADFENFKKRVEREAEDTRRQAAASLIGRILPVLDNFERALCVESAGDVSVDNLRKGVALIFRQMLDELRREGLEAIESVGQAFDPLIHDALETGCFPEFPPDTIVEELQRGYRLRGRVLRPALVKVNMTPSES